MLGVRGAEAHRGRAEPAGGERRRRSAPGGPAGSPCPAPPGALRAAPPPPMPRAAAGPWPVGSAGSSEAAARSSSSGSRRHAGRRPAEPGPPRRRARPGAAPRLLRAGRDGARGAAAAFSLFSSPCCLCTLLGFLFVFIAITLRTCVCVYVYAYVSCRGGVKPAAGESCLGEPGTRSTALPVLPPAAVVTRPSPLRLLFLGVPVHGLFRAAA